MYFKSVGEIFAKEIFAKKRSTFFKSFLHSPKFISRNSGNLPIFVLKLPNYDLTKDWPRDKFLQIKSKLPVICIYSTLTIDSHHLRIKFVSFISIEFFFFPLFSLGCSTEIPFSFIWSCVKCFLPSLYQPCYK